MTMPFLHSNALLPNLVLQSWAMHAGWTLAIAAALIYVLRAFPVYLRLAGVGLAIALNFLPATLTPGWWLGLAYQSPSLTLQGLCLLYLVRSCRRRDVSPDEAIASSPDTHWPNSLLILTTLLGWVLVLDMLAVVGVQLYALGFGANGVLASLLIAAVLELGSLRSRTPAAAQTLRDTAAVIVATMAVHLLLRLPTGNAWDALIDPWLWLGAQALLFSRTALWIVRIAAKRLAQRVRA